MRHVMIDIETLGTKPGSVILSIGACKFDPMQLEGAVIVDTFHQAITLASCTRAGLRMDADTVEWWLDGARRTAWDELQSMEKVQLDEALLGFSDWLRADDDTRVWANGADFDCVLLETAYAVTGIPCPWTFRQTRCFRTFKNLAPAIKAPDTAWTQHNAVDDACTQALWMRDLVEYLGIGEPQ